MPVQSWRRPVANGQGSRHQTAPGLPDGSGHRRGRELLRRRQGGIGAKDIHRGAVDHPAAGRLQDHWGEDGDGAEKVSVSLRLRFGRYIEREKRLSMFLPST